MFKQKATQMCVTVCTPTNDGHPFSITGAPAALADLASAVGATDATGAQAICLYDFLLIASGSDAATDFTADRYCGGRLNPDPNGVNINDVTVCSKLRKYSLQIFLGLFFLNIQF